MNNLREDIRDLHKWGNPPSEIAKILGVHVEQVENILVALRLMRRPEKPKREMPVPRERLNQMRKLDAEIQLYESKLANLRRHRSVLAGLEQSGQHLQQKIEEARR